MPPRGVAKAPPFVLRDYQLRTLDAIRQTLSEHRSVLATAPTGAGKTVMFSEVVRRALMRNLRCDIVVHREELLIQAARTVRTQTAVTPGIIWRTYRQWERPVRVIAHGSLLNREQLPPDTHTPDILILDEAHHASAPSWRHGVNLLQPRWLIGFTATPFRTDKEPLVPDPFAQVVHTITPQELITQGRLVPPIVESPAVSDGAGEPQPIGRAANLPNIYLQAIRYAIAQGRNKIILFVSGTPDDTPSEIGLKTQALLRQHGIPAGLVHEKSGSKQRKAACQAFEKHPTATLINYMTLTEGFDSTAVDCVILGRTTKSEATIIQMIGRGLRLHPGKKDCLILDFTGRTDIHNIIHYWRLDGPTAREREARERSRPEVSEQQLESLHTAFPQIVSAMGKTNADYPWFQPFDDRRVKALCLWDPDQPGSADTYLCVEPTTGQRWKVSRVRVAAQSGAPVQRVTRVDLSSSEAASAVLDLIGPRSNLYRRNASWRRQPATDRQKRRWHQIHGADPPDDITKGDATDAIAAQHFRNRVSPKLI